MVVLLFLYVGVFLESHPPYKCVVWMCAPIEGVVCGAHYGWWLPLYGANQMSVISGNYCSWDTHGCRFNGY